MNTLPHDRRHQALTTRENRLLTMVLLSTSVTLSAQSTPELPAGLSHEDWSAVQAVHDAERHAIAPTADGNYVALNPGQAWSSTFDGRGFTTRPNRGAWTWGLELESWGFAGNEVDVAGEAAIRVDGQRVSYDWNETLTEWYVNDCRGIEHGYTVHERPARNGDSIDAPLVFELSTRGELVPIPSKNGRSVRFTNTSGASVLNYAGLVVFDATGAELEASFSMRESHLQLAVEECGAIYPLTIDPIAQQAYIKASNTDVQDSFGNRVSISGDTLVVSAMNEDGGATGINGDPNDNSKQNSGAVYVFVRAGSTWTQQAYIKASNTDAFDAFGSDVQISGDTLVVSANREDSNATGIDGDQSDNSEVGSGAVYVFVRCGTTWSQQAYIKASNTSFSDAFDRRWFRR